MNLSGPSLYASTYTGNDYLGGAYKWHLDADERHGDLSGYLIMANGAGETGAMSVSGGSVVQSAGYYTVVGGSGNGILKISGSGVVTFNNEIAAVGNGAGSTGQITVSGGTLDQQTASFLLLGQSGTASADGGGQRSP